FGVNEAYILRNRQGMFRVEKSIRYERELLLDDRIRVEYRVAAFNGKALCHVHQLLNVSRGGCAARAGYVSLHVDLRSRKVAQISDPAVADALAGLARRHGASAAVSKA
ncbi:thioesterase family protein, partial [Rhizobiaceae sp. 2RAB30]